MSNDNKEFYDLLQSIVDEQTFVLNLSPRLPEEIPPVTCRQLSTSQLKKLIETVVDSPVTQNSFNSTASTVFKSSIVNPPSVQLNVIDRLLFIIETRIHSLSSSMTVTEEDKTIIIDFEVVRNKLTQCLKDNAGLLVPSSATEGKISIKFGVTLIDTETKLNEELYKNVNPNVQDIGELRKLIGEAFVHEIAKAIQSITIEDKTLDLSTVTFKSRIKTVESLPASLIQNVIEYIEKYKSIIEECLTVEGHTITIDGSLFSLR